MQKCLLSGLIILALSGCDSEDVVEGTMVEGSQTSGVNSADQGTNDTDTGDTDSSENTDSNDADNTATNGGATSDNTGSTTSDSGNTSDGNGDTTSDGGNTSDDAGSTTNDGGSISDDAGSATSDGGTISDDAGSATSDGGNISDDAGSATSDGGNISDDAGSATSDGGTINNDPTSGNSNGGQSSGNTGNTNGGSFESDQVGGSVIRQSTLSSDSQENICTTASAPNDYSDTRVGDFILHNNAWRTWRAAPGFQWKQCIYTNTNGAVVGWNYDWGPGQVGINGNPNPSGDYYVRSYPELIYGVKDEFRTSAPKSTTGLPVRLGDMPNISIDYSYAGPEYGEPRVVDASNNSRFPNGTTISGERNVSIESFLYNADENGQCSDGIVNRANGSNHVYEVMVWLDAGAERLPAGPGDFVTNVSIRGDAYKVYTKGSDPRYVAFVAQNPQTTGTIYWNDFTEWSKLYAHRVQQEFGARSNSVQIQDDWCVANIIVGTEIFWGAGNLDIYDWTITQKQP